MNPCRQLNNGGNDNTPLRAYSTATTEEVYYHTTIYDYQSKGFIMNDELFFDEFNEITEPSNDNYSEETSSDNIGAELVDAGLEEKSVSSETKRSEVFDASKATGLVLSGGGAKGAYQVGVLKALGEAGLLDDVKYISGDSIGAINAMLYCLGDSDFMYDVWEKINMPEVFEFDPDLFSDNPQLFSRDKVKSMMNDYLKDILLASSAMPVIYEAVKINGKEYLDGGLTDNEPIKPLYDLGVRRFIIIGLDNNKIFEHYKYPGAECYAIYPSHDLGDLFSGTLNYITNAKHFRELLGEKDGKLAVKTHFEKDPTYISLRNEINRTNYLEIKNTLKVETAQRELGASINKHMDYFNKIYDKYKDF